MLNTVFLTKYGEIIREKNAKCVIFPKGKTSWEGFVPPCKFKKGDVLISQAGNMVLFSHIDSENFVRYHCIISTSGDFRIAKNTSAGVGNYHNCTLANEYQKQRMYDKIKSAGYKYNQDTNKLEKLLEFKDGDICYIKTKDNNHIFIFNGRDKYGSIKRYVNLTKNGLHTEDIGIVCSESSVEEFRYATEEEKNKLFTAIKDHGYVWNPETKTLKKLPKFKDGDIVAAPIYIGGTWIGVYKQCDDTTFEVYCSLTADNKFNSISSGHILEGTRLATEEEKERLFRVIKEKGYKWNAEKKCLEKLIELKFKVGDKVRVKNGVSKYRIIDGVFDTYYSLQVFGRIDFTEQDRWELVPNKFDISTLKPFDKILVRDSDNGDWSCDLFSHYRGKDIFNAFSCISSNYRCCIPYEENKHLLGTTDDCDEFYKNW